MLAMRRVTCSRVCSTATAAAFRRHPLPHPPRLLGKAAHTVNLSNGTPWPSEGPARGSSSLKCAAGVAINAATSQPDKKMLKVRWRDGGEDLYPFVWLRDNCQCPACFHPVSLARRLLITDINLTINCTSVQVSEGGEKVEVQWSDGHLGTYGAEWLRERAFRGPRAESWDQQYRLKPRYWGREFQDNIPRASFRDLLHDDTALLNFLESLEVLGVMLVTDIPSEKDQIQLLAKRVGHMKPTQYGETFSVHNRLSPNNLAYTSDTLNLHSDLPCLANKPEIQMLHCIKQFTGEGGDTLLTDGFAAASKFRETNPEYFDILAQTTINFVDIGVDDGSKFHACWKAPIIDVNKDGSFRTINMHQMSRDSRFEVSSEVVAEWYAAMLAFWDVLSNPSNIVKLKLQTGNLIVLDNLRVLHGRLGYSAEGGERILQGGYLEWDSARSQRRVLRQMLA